MDTKQFYLKNFSLTRNLTDNQVSDLNQITVQRDARHGEVVYAKGGEKKIFLLISGQVKIAEIKESGDEMIKELLQPGDLFGDISVLETINYEYAEVVSERASYLAIDFNAFQGYLHQVPALTVNYLTMVSEKFKRLETRYVNMITKDVKSRLLYCFREWAVKEGKKLGDKVVLRNYLTHGDIASMISTSRQTVTVILNELKEAGHINYNRRQIEFSDVAFIHLS
ncbi:MAG: Crp/Fnr family transcriptional regulator [Bacteroidia bacterium]|nr:Crp/Fnr family transcriptional regulator [Bacteroidia bacterium]